MVVVDVYPDRNGLVVYSAQVWVSQLREWVGAIRLHLQYLTELNMKLDSILTRAFVEHHQKQLMYQKETKYYLVFRDILAS